MWSLSDQLRTVLKPQLKKSTSCDRKNRKIFHSNTRQSSSNLPLEGRKQLFSDLEFRNLNRPEIGSVWIHYLEHFWSIIWIILDSLFGSIWVDFGSENCHWDEKALRSFFPRLGAVSSICFSQSDAEFINVPEAILCKY